MVEADRQSLCRMFHYSLADLYFLYDHNTARDNLSCSCVLSIGGHVKPALKQLYWLPINKKNNLRTFYSHALPTYWPSSSMSYKLRFHHVCFCEQITAECRCNMPTSYLVTGISEFHHEHIQFIARETSVSCASHRNGPPWPVQKTVQLRPLTPENIKIGDSDCGVRHCGGVDHHKRLPDVTHSVGIKETYE